VGAAAVRGEATRAACLATLLLAGCGGGEGETQPTTAASTAASTAALTTAGGGDCAPGAHDLTLPNGQAARIQVGPAERGSGSALLLVLHGAGGTPESALDAFRAGWDEPDLVLVAPQSKGDTWSVLRSEVDEDLETVNLALAQAYERCRIDRTRIGVGGFSDGATYALTLAVSNGDLFPAAIAFSPGGVLGGEQRGAPRIWISHGTADGVLPIATTGDAVAARLREAGYEVEYRRFAGGHEVTDELSAAAVRWFLDE
jgi:phospholipase/carboxylesterase